MVARGAAGPGGGRDPDTVGRRAPEAAGVRARRAVGWASAALALAVTPACDRSTQPPGSADPPPRTVSEDEVQVLGTSDRITRVAELLPTVDGRVWVLNTAPPYFLVFDGNGRVERSFGDEGGGPDEFGFPVGLVAGPGGGVWTYDLLRHALTRVSGRDRRSVPLPQGALPPPSLVSFENATLRPGPLWMEATDDRILVARSVPAGAAQYSGRLWNAEIVALDLDGDAGPTVEPVLSLPETVGSVEERYPGATTFAPYPLWTSCPGGAFAIYDPNRNALRRIVAPDREVSVVELPQEQWVPLDAQGLFDMTYRQLRDEMPAGQLPDSAEWRRMMDEQFAQLGPRGADVFPEYADLQCSPDGRIWLQPFDVRAGGFGRGPRWLVVDEDGALEAWTFPEDFRPHAFTRDRVWGTTSDELGVQSVAWVERPGPP